MSNQAQYVLAHETPGIEEYRQLRVDAGLSPRSAAAASRGLPNTLFAATLRYRGELVAMARVVGDGGCNFEIVDMAVHPDHQRRGHGTRIMAAVMQFITANAEPSAYVSLIADDHSPKLYRKFGFEPVAPRSIGMARRI